MMGKDTRFAGGAVSEDALLRRLATKLGGKERIGATGVRLGIGDDAALWGARPGFETILTCDWFLEGTHFLREKHPADAVGWKCLARAISDIAAMGGTPRCFLLSLALPESHAGSWLEGFLKGLRRASHRFRCPAAGGDTTRQEKILINVTAIGEVKAGYAVRRSGAKKGDFIYVSGRLGEAVLGLRELRGAKNLVRTAGACLRKHLYPEPRLALGRWLASKRLATAMMDLSDGLSSDLPRLCAASGVGARIKEALLPMARVQETKSFHEAERLHAALDGGDDYELLFTVSPKKAHLLQPRIAGLRVTRIGTITTKREIVLVRKVGREEHLRAGGWDPFRP
jgi:thiamine-monophosphate kinase